MDTKIDAAENGDKILIVDDDMFGLTTLQTLMKITFDLEPKTCMNGQQALQLVQQKIENDKSTSPFKIIFMDCEMPLMNGYETTQKILDLCQKQNVDEPYIVALTAHDNEEVTQKCLKNGMKKCITKPASTNVLKQIFNSLDIL